MADTIKYSEVAYVAERLPFSNIRSSELPGRGGARLLSRNDPMRMLPTDAFRRVGTRATELHKVRNPQQSSKLLLPDSPLSNPRNFPCAIRRDYCDTKARGSGDRLTVAPDVFIRHVNIQHFPCRTGL
jgi:hypothetical protein